MPHGMRSNRRWVGTVRLPCDRQNAVALSILGMDLSDLSDYDGFRVSREERSRVDFYART